MSEGTIAFHYLTPVSFLRHRQQLKQFLLRQAHVEGKSIEHINYIFCTDDYLLSINQQYLRHDTYTDIVTFELNSPNQPLLSDIYISIDRVRENASLYGVSRSHELHRVIFHGLLHLCGYKDKKKADSALMRNKEQAYLSQYFVPRGTKR